jgi:hypothetical protein
MSPSTIHLAGSTNALPLANLLANPGTQGGSGGKGASKNHQVVDLAEGAEQFESLPFHHRFPNEICGLCGLDSIACLIASTSDSLAPSVQAAYMFSIGVTLWPCCLLDRTRGNNPPILPPHVHKRLSVNAPGAEHLGNDDSMSPVLMNSIHSRVQGGSSIVQVLCADNTVVGPLRTGKIEGSMPRSQPGKHISDAMLVHGKQVDRQRSIPFDRLHRRTASVDAHEEHRRIRRDGSNSTDGDAEASRRPISRHDGHRRCYTAHCPDECVP